MLDKSNYSFNGGNSIIHNINPILKIIGLLVYSLICLFKFNNILFICNISLVFLLLLLSNIDFNRYLKIIWKLKYFLIFLYVLLLRLGFSKININIILFEILFLVLYMAMIIYTTTKEDIAKVVISIVDRINIFGLNLKTIELMVLNILIYFDILMDSYNLFVIDNELKGNLLNSNILIYIKNRKEIKDITNRKMEHRRVDMKYRLYDKKIKRKYKYRNKLNVFDYMYVILFILMILFYVVRVR